jgi:hypothetical protein
MLFARSRFSCYCLFPIIKERLRCTHFPGYENFKNVLRLYDTMLNFVENLLVNERGPMNDQDLRKTDYDPDRSLVRSRVSLIF